MNLESLAQEFSAFEARTLGRLQALEEGSKAVNPLFNEIAKQIGELNKRITTLEEARQKQIALNSTYAIKQDPSKAVDGIQKPATWRWW